MLEIGMPGRDATTDEIAQAQCRYRWSHMPSVQAQRWTASARDLRPVRMATAQEFAAHCFGDPEAF